MANSFKLFMHWSVGHARLTHGFLMVKMKHPYVFLVKIVSQSNTTYLNVSFRPSLAGTEKSFINY